MKKIILLIISLFLLTLQGGCQEDKTFKVPINVVKIVYPDGSEQVSAIQSVSTTWESIIGKPATYPPAAHSHSYNDLTDKPATVPLQTAIGDLPYIELRQYTTTEINALVIPAGKVVEVWDKTLNCKKVWNGVQWKTYITNQ